MAKTIKNIKQKKSTKETFLSKFNLEEILPQKYHVLAVILVIFILSLAFFNPLYFGGKTFESGDIIASRSMVPYIENHTDGFTLWNPLIFCGMPAYALGTGYGWFNLIYVVFSAVKNLFGGFFSVEYARWGFYLIILAITSFLLMRHLVKNTLVSLFTSIATSFSTGLVVFLYIGHVTKLTSIAWYPLLFLLLLRMKEKFRLIDFFILIITLQLFIQGFHVQIIFYTFMAVALYFIFFFSSAIVKKKNDVRNQILKSAGAFVVAAVIALLIQSDNFSQVYQYTPFSTRGGKSIVEKSSSNVENPSSSAYYDYHTLWSFSPGEVLTFIVPSYYGFGNSTYDGPLTQNQPIVLNTYFGQMESVDVAMYMGVLIFFLGLFAIFTMWKEPYVRFLTILSAISLLISFGKNFPVLFDPLFFYLPYFNKFRVPIMILVLVQLSFPILAGFGLMKIISLRNSKELKAIKLIRNGSIVFTAIFILSLILKSSVSDWFTGRITEYVSGISQSRSQQAQELTALSPYMSDMFTGDLMIAFGVLGIAFWSAYFYISSKISKDAFIVVVILLTIFDLFRIDARGEKYVDNPDIKNMFNAPGYITAIKNQKDNEPFRMINIKQDGSLGTFNNNANYNAYFMVEDFYGYSGIKPRSYQDFIDVIGPVNPTLWRMANVKYIVADQQIPFPGFVPIYQNGKEIVYKNNDALPRIYFVNKVESKPDIDVLNEIKTNSFDPKNIAFVEEKVPQIDAPDSTASINISEYKDEMIKMNVKASGNNFLFFSDTYIPTGWKAYVDGNKTEIYKVNHGFMGIVVPNGKHIVEFQYAPTSFYITKYIDLSLSAIALLGLIITSIFEFKKKVKSKRSFQNVEMQS